LGFFDKLKSAVGAVFSGGSELNDEFYEELEETLILSDLGAQTAQRLTEALRARCKAAGVKTAQDARGVMRDLLRETLSGGERDLKLDTKPSVVLVVGVNGVGKTTTIGKLAYRLQQRGKRVLLCAGDTFRAAAADQLEIWAKRAGCEIVRQNEGADPAAVLFDAIAAAKARGADVIVCDTAGRLHNKQNLMNELNKMSRVIDRELPGASRETLLVLDATTGQNGLTQAKAFAETAGLTGLVLTKLDGTAKGGIVVAVCDTLRVPVKLVGVGEKIDALIDFDPADFAAELVGA
jgi:fused signal recognition particle receptor